MEQIYVVNQRLSLYNVSESLFLCLLPMKIIFLSDPPLPSQIRPWKNLTLIRGSFGVCPCLLDAYPPIESVSWYRNGRAVRMEYRGRFDQTNDFN